MFEVESVAQITFREVEGVSYICFAVEFKGSRVARYVKATDVLTSDPRQLKSIFKKISERLEQDHPEVLDDEDWIRWKSIYVEERV